MTTVLGIDTGGTYTDGVILIRETKEILASAKSHTTHENLINGIRSVIRKLDYADVESIDYVALSTTLATNAIVENNGCRVGALILGYDPEDLPPCLWQKIPAEINLSGKEIHPLDEDVLREAVASFAGKVDAVAISGIFSIRNPEHELRAAAIVKEILSVPVIMAHDLTGTLGVQERTNTAILNAKLISVIDDLMAAVKEAMGEKNIKAPLMIVKGDGSLMTEQIAKERPIETILSGPAASIIGATYLNDIENGLVVDMGGTTTDVAILADGKPLVTKEGADVGGWRTRVSAVNAYTFGLGGDSYFSRNNDTGLWEVGPRRSRPVSVIAKEFPYYKQELYQRRNRQVGLYGFGQSDGLILLREPGEGVDLTPVQAKLIEALNDGPHTVVELGKLTGSDPNFFHPERLIEYGIIGLVGFTPTDVLCCMGIYDVGDREAAQIAASLIADSRGLSLDAFYQDCIAKVEEKMGRSLLTCVLERSGLKCDTQTDASEFYFRHGFGLDESRFVKVGLTIDVPVIGIGAPIHAWLPVPAKKLGVEPVISKNHGVANAVGAAAGKVMTIYSVVVQNHGGEYLCIYAPWGKQTVLREEGDSVEAPLTVEEMVEPTICDVIADAKARLRNDMIEQGIYHYEILVERKDSRVSRENCNLFIESKIDVIAVGLPSWAEKE
ncbi:MAG: hydantoinase/oxoprolinase family protein [Firmicutes bacterium]|nr:hydantoinase/oxoprolinase family protein [Bacillota bacterium]